MEPQEIERAVADRVVRDRDAVGGPRVARLGDAVAGRHARIVHAAARSRKRAPRDDFQSCMEIPTRNGFELAMLDEIGTAPRAVARGSSWTDPLFPADLRTTTWDPVSCVRAPLPGSSVQLLPQNSHLSPRAGRHAIHTASTRDRHSVQVPSSGGSPVGWQRRSRRSPEGAM